MPRSLFTCILLSYCLANGEDIKPKSDSTPSPISTTITDNRTTFIPHPLVVEPFTPPAPLIPKTLAPCRIDASVAHPASQETSLIIKRGEPSEAPNLPLEPPARAAEKAKEPTPEQIARHLYHIRHSFYLGATIIDHRISVLQWRDQESGTAYEAVCGFDVGLLAGIGSFCHQGESYSFMLMHSHISTERIRKSLAPFLPALPTVADGQIIITKGDASNRFGCAPAKLLGELIEVEKERLITYQLARDAYQKQAAQWLAANPPEPRNETFLFRPHRGSRYLPKVGGEK
jgi:hypothetical protein